MRTMTKMISLSILVLVLQEMEMAMDFGACYGDNDSWWIARVKMKVVQPLTGVDKVARGDATFLLKTPQLMDEDEDNGGVRDARRWPSWWQDGV